MVNSHTGSHKNCLPGKNLPCLISPLQRIRNKISYLPSLAITAVGLETKFGLSRDMWASALILSKTAVKLGKPVSPC